MAGTAAAIAMLAALVACDGEKVGAAPADTSPSDKPELGLLTTLPIYWNEAADLQDMLSPQDEAPWPRTVMEQKFTVLPLDSLEGESGLASVDTLMLAQPRALSAAENVALDDWVRAGGTAVILADPLLTSHSQFHIGDRRRPQDVVLLSPILGRWGLTLEFLEDQPEGERAIALDGRSVPVNLPGRLQVREGFPTSDVRCGISRGVLAKCRIGKGSVVVLADAALLEHAEGDSLEVRKGVLQWLLDIAGAKPTVRGDVGTYRLPISGEAGPDGDERVRIARRAEPGREDRNLN